MAKVAREVRDPEYVPNGNEVAVIETSKGTIEVKLFGRECPLTVGNFVELSQAGFYDKLAFHARKEDSVVLGGCPTTRNMPPNQVYMAAHGGIYGVHPGTGEASYRIKDEFEGNPLNRHLDGSIVMARKSDPDSGSCQFYFSLSEQPEFDGKFTVFGKTVEGLDVVHALRVGDRIESIRIEGAMEPAE